MGIKDRRRKPILRLGSYKPMTFRSWVVDFEDAYVVDGRMTREEAQRAVAKTDVVWLAGGDSPKQFQYLQKYGLDTVIKQHQGSA